MARRSLAFGLRLRDKDRTVKVSTRQQGSRSTVVVEDERKGSKTRRRQHGSTADAVHDAASTWRSRLH